MLGSKTVDADTVFKQTITTSGTFKESHSRNFFIRGAMLDDLDFANRPDTVVKIELHARSSRPRLNAGLETRSDLKYGCASAVVDDLRS